MKSKLYRVLVLLVAIAMMIPSFAFAEDAAKTPSIKIEGTETTFKKEVLSTEIGSQVSTGLKYTVADVPDTAVSKYVKWESDAPKVVAVTSDRADGSNGTHDVPSITLKAYEGTAKLTGTLYVNEAAVGTPVVVTVTLTSKDVEKIAFKKAAYEVLLTDMSKSFKDEVEVTPAEWWTTTSIRQDAIDWSIPKGKGDDCASVDVNGNVKFVKAGTVTLQASLDGSKVAAATTTLTIIDNEQDPQDPEPAEGYTKLQFTAENFALPYSYSEIDLMDPQYLSVRFVGDTTTDSLVWEVDKPQIATITYGVTAGAEPVPFAKIMFDTLFGEENKVHVTVHSRINPTIKSECDVWMLPAPEFDDIEKIEFNPASVTVREGQKVNARDYIKLTPAKLQYMSAWLTWSSNDESVATVEYGGTITAEGEGDAVITAGQYGGVVGKFNVKVVKAATKPVKTLKFSEDTIEVREGNNSEALYLSSKLIKDPYNTDDTLIWTSDDTTVVNVNSYGTASINPNAKAGMSAKISVRNIDDTVKVETPLTIKIVKAPSKPVTDLKFSQDELIVKKSASAMSLKSLYLVPTPTDSDEQLVWTSSDSSVVMVDKTTGYASFNNIGETTINVRNEDNTVSTKKGLVIKVVKDKDAYTEITPTEKSVKISSSINLDAYITTKGNIAGLDELVWTSSNQQILSFPTENSGATKLNPNKIGKVTVTVRNKVEPIIKCTFEVEVTDNRKPIQKIELTQDTFELEPDGKIYLGRYIVTDPVDYVGDELIFTSDDPSVVVAKNTATYDAALYEDGEAHITVRSKLNPDVSKQFTIILKAKGADSIAFKDAPKTFYKEMKTLDLRDYLVTEPADYVEKHSGNLVWESSDPTVALAYNEQPWVDNVTKTVYGCLTYVQPGNVTITVTDKVSGKSAKVDLVLKEKHPVESIELKDVTLDVDDFAGLYDFLSFKPLDANFDESKLTFTSSNREVAEVVDPENEDIAVKKLRDKTRGPLLVAYKAGTTKITAYYELDDKTILKDTCVVTVEEVELDKVKISQDKYTLKLNTKMDAVVRFNVEPFNCTFEKEDLYVISADPEIVEVSEIKVDTESHKGKFTITGKKPGTAWVVVKRAKDDKALDACKVKVKAVAVKSVGWEKKTVKMYYYDDGKDEVGPVPVKITNKVYRNTLQVKPIINPVEAYCKVSFETSDPSVAFINDNYYLDFASVKDAYVDLICVGPGKCKITMKVDDGKKVRKAVLNVEVETKLPKLKLSEKRATLKLEKGKDTLQLRAYDANTDTDLEVKWASSNTKVAKVNVDGKVRAVGAGTATITATTKNGQKQVVKCKITVKAPSTENDAAKKITGDTKVTVKAGEKKALEIKVKPEGAKVTFTSSDSKIVKVTKDGTIKGIKVGKATITVKAAEGKAELKIKVVVK